MMEEDALVILCLFCKGVVYMWNNVRLVKDFHMVSKYHRMAEMAEHSIPRRLAANVGQV